MDKNKEEVRERVYGGRLRDVGEIRTLYKGESKGSKLYFLSRPVFFFQRARQVYTD